MRLSPSIKITYDWSHRVVSLQETFDRARNLMEKIGVTDIHDMTDYDAVAIPVWSVCQSKSTNPSQVSAYGKGISSLQSQVSAMMEAVERYTAAQFPTTIRRASYCEMRRQFNVLDPDKVARDSHSRCLEDFVFEWLPGVDLFTGKELWVPANCVLLCPTLSGSQFFPMRTSNGLASGNTFEEAVCHGLCELIERDAWTLAWLRTVTIPYIHMVAHKMLCHPGSIVQNSGDLVPNAVICQQIDSGSLPNDVRQLIAQFERAGVTVIIRDITSDIGIPAFLAVSREAVNNEMCDIQYGTGSHPNAQVAVVRAITECAQSRLAAAHEPNKAQYRVQSADMELFQQNLFLSTPNRVMKDFSSIPTYCNPDILDDIDSMLARLSSVGLHQAIAVGLTLPEVGMPVTRVLIPGIENWSTFHFAFQHCVLGRRGRACIGNIR